MPLILPRIFPFPTNAFSPDLVVKATAQDFQENLEVTLEVNQPFLIGDGEPDYFAIVHADIEMPDGTTQLASDAILMIPLGANDREVSRTLRVPFQRIARLTEDHGGTVRASRHDFTVTVRGYLVANDGMIPETSDPIEDKSPTNNEDQVRMAMLT